METMQNQNIRLAVAFVIGLVVGVGGYWLATQSPGTPGEEVASNEEDTGPVIQSDNGVIVKDQMAGNSVKLVQVVLKNPGWVAIHDDVDGIPGKILGAQLFDAGSHEGNVDLLRRTVDGKKYIAVIHMDDGDYKYFNTKTDLPINDQSGKPIMVTFTASGQDTTTTGTTSAADNYK